jgi:peptide/nickel transport system substrate-binding protein
MTKSVVLARPGSPGCASDDRPRHGLCAVERRRLSRRQALGVGGTLAGAAVLSACGQTSNVASSRGAAPRRGGIALVSFGGAETSDKLDPSQVVDFFNAFSGGLLYDALLAVDFNNQPIPALATEWSSSKDLRTWTFQLRRGVEFHDGRPFTSADAVFSIRRLLNPALGSPATSELAPFLSPASVQPRGPYAIEFSLMQPSAFMPNLLATFYPRMVPDGTTPAEADAKAIGTGPFRLQSFQPGVELTVDRNPYYWQPGRPYLDGIRVSVITDQSTKLESVLSGDADACDSILFSAFSQVRTTPNVQLLSAPDASFLTLSAYQKDAPNTDVRVRQALKYAIDRQRIAEEVFFGNATVTPDVCIAPVDPLYPASIQPFPYDPDKARFLLKQAGYPDGIGATLLCSELAPGMTDLAVLVQETAGPAGFSFSVRQLPVGTYYGVAPGKPYWIDTYIREHAALIMPQMYDSNSPDTANESGFSDPRVSDLIVQAQSTLDIAKQRQAITDAFEIINDTCGQLIPCQLEAGWVVKDQLRGVQLSCQNVANFTNAYFA